MSMASAALSKPADLDLHFCSKANICKLHFTIFTVLLDRRMPHRLATDVCGFITCKSNDKTVCLQKLHFDGGVGAPLFQLN